LKGAHGLPDARVGLPIPRRAPQGSEGGAQPLTDDVGVGRIDGVHLMAVLAEHGHFRRRAAVLATGLRVPAMEHQDFHNRGVPVV
jgi:hypothetical protein